MAKGSVYGYNYFVNIIIYLLITLIALLIINKLIQVIEKMMFITLSVTVIIVLMNQSVLALDCTDDSLASYQYNTICLLHPAISEPNWQDTLNQLLLAKGIPLSSVIYVKYDNLEDIVISNSFTCDYNIVLIDAHNYDDAKYSNLDQVIDILMYNWQCYDMDVNLYYYAQKAGEVWMTSGTCTVKVCPLNQQTLGIGCNVANPDTFATLTDNSDKFELIDVVDDINYKINISVDQCKIRRCYRQSERTNVAIIQVAGYNVYDISESPVTYKTNARMMRINWKKWWAVFYQVVDFINDIITTMVRQTNEVGSFRVVRYTM
uniref:Outer capsid glycoprotein VP7 n=1 Tax=Rotavirus D TaxID=335100 RepID=A0A3G1RPM1_9REOV|nr:MAG: viral structural protein 7 [Rotavirus D]